MPRSVPDRGDLLELLVDALGRLPAISAEVRTWTRTKKQRERIDAIRHSKTGGLFGSLTASRQREQAVEVEETERLLLAPRAGAFRLRSTSPPHLVVCDGTTTWMEIARDEVLRLPLGRLQSPAVLLLDPSWLTGYDWSPPAPATRNGRPVLHMAVQPRVGTQTGSTGLFAALIPMQAEVVIDTQLGFLHKMTGFTEGRPDMVLELLDVHFPTEIDDTSFQLDEPQYQIIDRAELSRGRRRSFSAPTQWSLAGHFQRRQTK